MIHQQRDKEKTARRGETIGIVFAMQGVGAVVGSTFFLVLIYFSDQGDTECDINIRPGVNSAGVDRSALNAVWRSFYFIGLIFVVMVFLYRWLLVDEGKEGVKKMQARKANRSAAGKLTYRKIFGLYGTHVIATGGCWFLWDIAFYVRI
jgi:MFS family permease